MADTHRVDRTDRHLQFQSPYEGGRVNIQFEGAGEGYGQSGYGGGGGYGQSGYGGGGYKSMMPESGPSSTQLTGFFECINPEFSSTTNTNLNGFFMINQGSNCTASVKHVNQSD
ncbi:hypothetical protein F2Q70_00027375 [Brassica cretica]|uniref:Uncharacterized protein n=1 Tax=Brassica cretica TaxID=69181 RepID=A0A8S9LFI5_BRACR|nr:hypothetical protein F2Q70_00027375 [Brassica cretica]